LNSYYTFIHHQGEKTGYNGVAVISKTNLQAADKSSFINDARHLAVRFKDIEIHNFYIPAGGDIPDINQNPKFKYKLDFIDSISDFFAKNRSKSDQIVVAGDFNVAPLEYDVWSHKQLLKIVSHTHIEVEKLSRFYGSVSFSDSVRKFTDESEKLYSWWSYRVLNDNYPDRFASIIID